MQQSWKGLSERPNIGVAIMSEQSTFSHQAEKYACSNPVSSREISSGEKIIDSTKIGGETVKRTSVTEEGNCATKPRDFPERT